MEGREEHCSGFVHMRAQNSLIHTPSLLRWTQSGICPHSPPFFPNSTLSHGYHMWQLCLTLGWLVLHLLPVLLQHRLALGGGKYLCWHYPPSFPLPHLFCPYSAQLKQETVKTGRLSFTSTYNSQISSYHWRLQSELHTFPECQDSLMSLRTQDQNYNCKRSQ